MTDAGPIELMVIEDNPQDLELAMLALCEFCPAVRIHVSRDGAEAMDYIFCEGAFAGRPITDRPKVILLDLKLPKVDGLAVLKRLKGDIRTRSIPVVMLTSSREQRDIVESYDLGVNSYIVKSGQPQVLRSHKAPWLVLAGTKSADGIGWWEKR
jgi:CheY-like chemotaxis protein